MEGSPRVMLSTLVNTLQFTDTFTDRCCARSRRPVTALQNPSKNIDPYTTDPGTPIDTSIPSVYLHPTSYRSNPDNINPSTIYQHTSDMAARSPIRQQTPYKELLLSDDTKIFLVSQVNTLIQTARKLRLEGERAPAASGELRDRAAEILCVASNLLAMLAQATREEAESLQNEFWQMGVGSPSTARSDSISPLDLGEPWGVDGE